MDFPGFDFMQADAPRETNEEKAERTRTVGVFKTMDTKAKMRLLSEAALDAALDWRFEPGTAYHVLSNGDVDSLTYLRRVLREQRARYVMVTTWCMATADAEEMRSWLDRGMVGRFDFYVGEIFKGGYRGCRDVLDGICERCGGRVARFRNHAKLMVVYGERFDLVIESSANIDTNPRVEQTVITVGDTGLCDFYKEFFDGVNDFDGGYRGWKPWQPKQR